MDFIIFWTLFIHLVENVCAHGRLWEPPARSTMWRRGYNTPINPNDNELNCGGYMNQWFQLSGKCGVCGDPFNEYPRPNESGGKYATGLITTEYVSGGVIDLGVQLTANHLGYFEFRICPKDNSNRPVTQNCLNKYPIRIIGSKDGRYHVTKQDRGLVMARGKLPENLQCKHCVLQWRYRSGNRWSCDRRSGKCGKGLGSQEEFYGCADVSVASVDHTLPQLRRGNHRYAASPEIRRKFINNKRSNSQGPTSLGVNLHKVSDVLLSLLRVVASATKSRGRHVANIKWDPIGGLYGKDVVQFDDFKYTSDEVDDWEPRIIEADLPFDINDHSSFLLSEITSPLDLKTPVRMMDKRVQYPRVFKTAPRKNQHKKFPKSKRVCYGTHNYRHVNGMGNWCNINCRAGNCPAAVCTCHVKQVSTSGEIHGHGHNQLAFSKSTSANPAFNNPFDPRRLRPISRPEPTQRFLGKGTFHHIDSSRQVVSQVLNNQGRTGHRKSVGRPVQKSNKVPLKRCIATGKFSRKTMDDWCNHNCAKGFCPASICKCS